MNNKYKSLIKDTLIFAVGSIGVRLILFFLVPLYTNFLSKEEFGIADLIFTVSQFIIPFVSLVIFDAVMRFGLSKDEKKEDVLLCGLLVCGVGSLVTVLLTPLLGFYETIAPWKWHLSLYVVIALLLYVEQNYVKAKGQNKLYVAMSITQTLTMALTNILFIVIIPMGIDGYVIANIVGISVSALGFFLFGRLWRDLKVARFSPKLLKRMLLFSAPLILNNISWWVIYSANKIVVEAVLGAAVLGLYTAASKIPALINVVISIFQQSWGISSVKEVESSNDSDFYSNIFNVFSFIAFAMSIGLILIIKPFMTLYVGAEFVESWRYVPILLASATFSAISSYFVSMYAALKKSVNNMVTTLIGALLNLGICLLLVKEIGIWAAVIGTFAAYFVMAIARMVDVKRYLKIKVDLPRLILNTVILIAEAVLVSFEIRIYLVSSVALVLFLLVNFKFMKLLLQKFFKKTA